MPSVNVLGGETRFWIGDEDEESKSENQYFDIKPDEPGCYAFFPHKMMHTGKTVISGTKYVLRTDIMYTRQNEQQIPEEYLKKSNLLSLVYSFVL